MKREVIIIIGSARGGDACIAAREATRAERAMAGERGDRYPSTKRLQWSLRHQNELP